LATKTTIRTLALALSALPLLQIILALVLTASTASATSTEIIVISSETATVYVADDGSADIKYEIHISVRPQSSAVSQLLIHMPNWRFELSGTSVTLDGATLRNLKKTGSAESNIQINFETGEGLQPGSSHILILVSNVGAMVLKHPSDQSRGRITFSPTWWNPDIVQEIQDLRVSINLPEGFLDQAKISYSSGAVVSEHGNRIVLNWALGAVPTDTKVTLHVDIPASAVDKVYDPFWDIQFHFYQNYLLILLLIIPIVVIAYGVKRALRRPYIKPYLNIEGWGPRTGFGPMEAAMLLDVERERVAAMFLVDLIMVEAIAIKDPETMAIDILNPDHEGRSAPFLGCIRAGRLDPIPTTNFLGDLRDEVLAKLEGYDIAETKAHYTDQGEPRTSRKKTLKAPTVDEVLWLMTGPNATTRFKENSIEGIPDWTAWKVIL